MSDEIIKVVKEEITKTIGVKVNGEIHKIANTLEEQNKTMAGFIRKVDSHIQRVEPVIKKYEEEKAFGEEVRKYSERAIFWAKVIGAIGVILISIKMGLISLIPFLNK